MMNYCSLDEAFGFTYSPPPKTMIKPKPSQQQSIQQPKIVETFDEKITNHQDVITINVLNNQITMTRQTYEMSIVFAIGILTISFLDFIFCK